MPQSLMQKVLGADWPNLPIVLQKHYQISGEQQSCLEGRLTIGYPGYLFPQVWLIHLIGGLVLWRSDNVLALVQKTADPVPEILHWRRILSYADGKTDYFRSQMNYVAEHELIETIGFGFGLRLQVEVSDGDLLYRSRGYFWRWGRYEIAVPDYFLLGAATIREHAVSEDTFYLDFTLTHPLWGVSYFYRGHFAYCPVNRTTT